ncbi:swr complex subunit [Saitoella coloradoensis]
MTSADVRDAFNLPAKPEGAPPAPKKVKVPQPRLDGITRELYSLLGDNVPPVAIQQNKFKERPKLRQKAASWLWKPFSNGARADELQLSHWVKKIDGQDGEAMMYRFEEFNKSVDIIQYTDMEYNSELQDGDWSREETDYLFSLCKEYDLRFVVIADRYDFQGKQRSMEEIKDRYYAVGRKITTSRTPLSIMTPQQMDRYHQLQYDKSREVERKAYVTALLQRSPEEVAEEEALFIEAKRIEANEKRMAQERAELLRLLESPPSKGSIASYTGSQGLAALANNMLLADKNKKKKPTIDGVAGVPGATATPPAKESPAPQKKPQHNALKKLTQREEVLFGISYHEKLTPGVALRSTKLSNLKPTVAQKVTTAMTELGISTTLTMPTARTSAMYEQLQQAIGVLLETKKQADKLETEIRVARARGGSFGEADAEGRGKRGGSVDDVGRSSKRPKKA